jgi:hypothetical protein
MRAAKTRVGLGFRALKGGSVVVGIAADGSEPRILWSSFLATASAGDRLSLEPYHVAAAMKRAPGGGASAEAKAAVAEGCKRQGKLATAGLKDIINDLRKSGAEIAAVALLINRAGWIDDLLDYSLAWPDHPPVAEGLAVRDALRTSLRRLNLAVTEWDEKSLFDAASKHLGIKDAKIEAHLRALGQEAGRPWRKEQKLAALAAWIAISARTKR